MKINTDSEAQQDKENFKMKKKDFENNSKSLISYCLRKNPKI